MSVPRRGSSQKGFSLLELLVVVGIILIVSAVASPQIYGYVRLYRLRTATQQVTSQMQAARAKAIMKNVNLGVLWVAQGTRSTWMYEDDMLPQTTPNWTLRAQENLNTLVADRAQGPGWVNLPDNIVFDSPSSCPGGAGATTWGLRFGRLGAACGVDLTATTPPDCATKPGTLLPSMPNSVWVRPSDDATCAGCATVCLHDQSTNIRRAVTVTAGGRVIVQQ